MTTPRPALIASAMRVKLSEKPTPRKTFEWQNDGWTAYFNIGEVQHAIDFIANHISKVKLFGAFVPTDPRENPKPDDDTLATAAIEALRTRGGEYSAVLRELAVHLYVAGECYLVGFGGAENEVENWEILSTDELQVTDQAFLIRDYPSGPPKPYTDAQIVVIRIYFPDPRWGALPTSSIRGILPSAEEIQRIERVIRSAARSRSAGPGLLLIPDEASFGNMDPTTESSGDGNVDDPFIKTLMDSMMTPIQNEEDASGVVPIVLTAPADVLKEIRHVSLAIDVDTELIKLDRALTRLAQGLPLPPEVVTGKEGLSHWTAWSVDEAVITAYIEPVLAPIVNALTIEYYRPYLIAGGKTEEEARKRQLWYDVTGLVTRPNRSADADFGLEHIAISDAAWRKVKGFTDDEMPTPIEKLARLLLQRGSLDPISTVVLLKELGIVPRDVEPSDIQIPPTPQPPRAIAPESRNPPPRKRNSDDAPPRRSASSAFMLLPPTTTTSDTVSTQLLNLDRDLATRLHTAAEAAVTRALERASSVVVSRLKRKSRYSTIIRDTPKLEAASRVGRPALEAEGVEISALFASVFDPLATKFREWTARTYTKASKVLSIPIPTPIDLISSAADTLISDLFIFASDRLFNPDPAAEPSGESSDTILPFGIIRSALYRAGGGTSLLPSELSPPGAIATGANTLRAILDSGGTVDGWEWCYSQSVRTRDFEPHYALDGARFYSFSDRGLRNPGTWPPVTNLYAGDHDHCQCQIRPLITLPATEATG